LGEPVDLTRFDIEFRALLEGSSMKEHSPYRHILPLGLALLVALVGAAPAGRAYALDPPPHPELWLSEVCEPFDGFSADGNMTWNTKPTVIPPRYFIHLLAAPAPEGPWSEAPVNGPPWVFTLTELQGLAAQVGVADYREVFLKVGPTGIPVNIGSAVADRAGRMDEICGYAPEYPVIEIPLSGALAAGDRAIAGLGWYGDTLIMLTEQGRIYALPKSTITAYLDGGLRGPLYAPSISFDTGGVEGLAPRFEGFEGIAFAGDQVSVIVHGEVWEVPWQMTWLVRGSIAPDLSRITLDPQTMTRIQPQSPVPNYNGESVFTVGESVVTVHEIDDPTAVYQPVAHVFPAGGDATTIPFPPVGYRITDVTQPDASGLFWALNTNQPDIDPKERLADDLFGTFGMGLTHSQSEGVERLVALRYTESGIELAGEMIQLQIAGQPRQWEGLARLDGRGWLLGEGGPDGARLGFVAAP
jgi:hypothetical protein